MADTDRWTVVLDPPVLLPGRTARVSLTYRPDHDHESRGVNAMLRCVERYRYSRTETRTAANGMVTSHRVTKTSQDELARIEVTLAGAGRFVGGQPETWQFELEVPALGPATFEGDVLRCDWTLEAKVDIPMGADERLTQSVRVAQPMALLRAGVVATGQYGLYEEAPANVDHYPAQIRLEPTPICLTEPFSGSFTVETAEPIEVQEVRLELRVKAEVTVRGGHEEEILVGVGRLAVRRAASAASSAPIGFMRMRMPPGCRRSTCPMVAGGEPSTSSWPRPGPRTSTTCARSRSRPGPSSRPESPASAGPACVRRAPLPRLRRRPGGRPG